MALLVLGLALWILAHAFERLAPGLRAGLSRRLGAGPARGVIAAIIGVGLLCMILGYRAAPSSAVYAPPTWGIHLNNLLMLGAVALMGMGRSRGRARTWLRHPMLTGVAVWAVAHLLVNGDLASILLFGGLGVWAVGQTVMINRTQPVWIRPAPGPASGDIRLAVIALVLFGVIAAIHTWLGYYPFPR